MRSPANIPYGNVGFLDRTNEQNRMETSRNSLFFSTLAPKMLGLGFRFVSCCLSTRYPVFHVVPHSLFEPTSYRTGVK